MFGNRCKHDWQYYTERTPVEIHHGPFAIIDITYRDDDEYLKTCCICGEIDKAGGLFVTYLCHNTIIVLPRKEETHERT